MTTVTTNGKRFEVTYFEVTSGMQTYRVESEAELAAMIVEHDKLGEMYRVRELPSRKA